MLTLSLHQLEYVIAVYKAGSIKAAAEQLHISQPSLSVALSKVEDHLGKKLFLRARGKTVSPTNFGRMFVREAEAIVSNAERLFRSGRTESPAGPGLVLGCFTDLAPRFIGQMVRVLQTTFPGADIAFEMGDFTEIASGLTSGRLDLAITYDIGLDARHDRRLLRTMFPSAFLAPDQPLAARDKVSLKDLSDHPVILSDEILSAQHFLKLFHDQGLRPVIRHRTRSLEAMRSLAANGAGIGLSYTTPPGPVAYDGKPVIAVPITDKAAAEPVMLVSLKEQTDDPWLRSAADCLIDKLI